MVLRQFHVCVVTAGAPCRLDAGEPRHLRGCSIRRSQLGILRRSRSNRRPLRGTLCLSKGAENEAARDAVSLLPEQEIAYPSRLVYYLNEDGESTYHNLDTRARSRAKHGVDVHLAQAILLLRVVTCQRPASRGGEHCYYHGQIRGNNGSRVAMSTCNGLHGMFDDGVHVYLIEPLRQTHSIVSIIFKCRYESNIHILVVAQRVRKQTHNWKVDGSNLKLPRRNAEEMKYVEIMIVSDHSMIFKDQLHTRVVLVAMEIWTDRDHIPISVIPLNLLKDFSKYRQQHIKQHADTVHLFSNVTFHYRRSSAAYFGGMCSMSRGVGVNEYGSAWTMAASLSQSLAQNLGIQWDPEKRKDCGCLDSWVGCIMEDTGVQHPRKFSKCSITDYKEFLLRGGGSCLFNKPTKLFEPTECGNGYVEAGEECDCGVKGGCHNECCKKCSLSNGAHCSDGPCCNTTCLFYPRGHTCRFAVSDCDISETCSGDSGQCPPNLHKQDGYFCHLNQGRCYGGQCKTRESQCKYVWGQTSLASEKFCYEKLNTEGSEKGNCGKDGDKWIQCSKHDVFCGYLLCANVGRLPRIGVMKGEITPTTFNHQGHLIDCSGAHVLLDDETDLGYVEDGMPCGPSMMCLDRKCLPIQSLNMSACPSGPNGHVCSAHGVCNNEATCTCETTWAGTDCSIPDPLKKPAPSEDEGPRVSMATNRLIGAVAGTILALGVIFGGTGWGIE
uniref:Uncharacterized protein n=1 Tax=Denticeps clupeoides TaxID=299321 RepID=A0AAY4F026_9TELE